jgi:GNAT superfamily N-acetyltransferase
MWRFLMIHKLANADFQTILDIINDASLAYRGKIPSDCWKEPYMSSQELKEEIDCGVEFYGYTQNDRVVAVMGYQSIKDVTLIRHAYTYTSHQKRGIGEKLLSYLLGLAETNRVLVGTWEDALWAIRFYQKHGFKLLSRKETNQVLRKYWNIPKRQVETSVALEQERHLP